MEGVLPNKNLSRAPLS